MGLSILMTSSKMAAVSLGHMRRIMRLTMTHCKHSTGSQVGRGRGGRGQGGGSTGNSRDRHRPAAKPTAWWRFQPFASRKVASASSTPAMFELGVCLQCLRCWCCCCCWAVTAQASLCCSPARWSTPASWG
jgi:hypothetical protein